MEDVSPAWAFVLLGVSLVALHLSTRQFRWFVRMPIWLAGVAALAASAWVVLNDPAHVGVVGLAFDASRNQGESVVALSLAENWATVGTHIVPMFDLFLAAAAVLALVAFIALTPGDWVERLARPLMVGLLGAIVGGFLALALVAVGFGGSEKRRTYAGILTEADVIDGDTIRMGAVSLRLWGIDAPEARQMCREAAAASGADRACGQDARRRLVELVSGEDVIVVCKPPPDIGEHDPPKETFGRPIVTCRAGANGFDLAQRMAAEGFADVYRDGNRIKSSYLAYVEAAQRDGLGMWQTCTLRPAEWRTARLRRAFLAGQNPGTCPG